MPSEIRVLYNINRENVYYNCRATLESDPHPEDAVIRLRRYSVMLSGVFTLSLPKIFWG